ncbi:MAG: MarR family winged helix-turn-helix transcriptional regulator [Lachnospiraceae bacterium]
MQENYFGPTMKKISEEMERRANGEIKKYRLTLTQARVILFLSGCADKTATQKELEDYLQVSHPTTVTIIKSMESKNIVETFPDDEDRRMKNVKLVWGNEEIYQELHQNAGNMEVKLLEGFTKEEKEQFLSFLDRALKNISK